jgi:RimJ/RimL family protein N-acetyltransferase
MGIEEPDLIVVGDKAALGPLRRDLAATYARWWNQIEVRRGLDRMGISTQETEEKWVDDNLKDGAEQPPKSVEFTVYDRSDAAPVGTVGLFGIEHTHGLAKLGIAIGERRGQGLGTDATRLALDYAFHVLHLHNVMLEVLEWNAAGVRAYERAGFRRIGLRRGAVVSRGARANMVLMDAVPEDFGASVLG